MSTGRLLLLAAWLLLAALPFVWWLRSRRAVDVWAALPLPAALLAADGSVRSRTGPDRETPFELAAGLPARGQVVRVRGRDGGWLALSGVRGGALAVALPGEAVTERRDRALADLGSRLAHDINTPLGALHGHLDLIAHEPISPPALASVRTCQRELLRLQATAQDLLTFTRLRSRAGQRTPQLAGALAEEAAAALLDEADRRGVELTVAVPAEPVRVLAAEADLVRALRNLVTNAMVHGTTADEVDRTVVVAVSVHDDAVAFTVSDPGPGLTPTDLEVLTAPLVRGTGRAGEAGSGLGLAIVAEVLAAHGSALCSGRDSAGRAALTFTLPRLP